MFQPDFTKINEDLDKKFSSSENPTVKFSRKITEELISEYHNQLWKELKNQGVVK